MRPTSPTGANLADLFDVCDWLAKQPYAENATFGVHQDVDSGQYLAHIVSHSGDGANPTDALLSAAEAALGLDPWEEVANA